jgi:hypothetical protein
MRELCRQRAVKSSNLAVLEPASSAAAHLHGRAKLLVHTTVFYLTDVTSCRFLCLCVRRANLDRDRTTPIIVFRFVAPATRSPGQTLFFVQRIVSEQTERPGDDCLGIDSARKGRDTLRTPYDASRSLRCVIVLCHTRGQQCHGEGCRVQLANYRSGFAQVDLM